MIEAARSVLTSGEVPRLEIAEVAEPAGIARSTVYLAFGTRSAFMATILDDSLSRAGFGRLREYLGLPDAGEAMEKSLARAAVMYAAEAHRPAQNAASRATRSGGCAGLPTAAAKTRGSNAGSSSAASRSAQAG